MHSILHLTIYPLQIQHPGGNLFLWMNVLCILNFCVRTEKVHLQLIRYTFFLNRLMSRRHDKNCLIRSGQTIAATTILEFCRYNKYVFAHDARYKVIIRMKILKLFRLTLLCNINWKTSRKSFTQKGWRQKNVILNCLGMQKEIKIKLNRKEDKTSQMRFLFL